MKSKFNIYQLLLALCFLYSCSSESSVTIDNPTDKEIRVSFDDKDEIVISAHAHKKTNVEQGDRTLYLNGEEVGTITADGRNQYLVNPTQSKYYIERVEYASEGMSEANKNMYSEMNKKTEEIPIAIIMIDTLPYIGNVMVDSSILIKDIWDYDVFEELPQSIEMQGYGIQSKVKIFREYAMANKTKKLHEQIDLESKRKEKLEQESSE